jgi:hypothetical protein
MIRRGQLEGERVHRPQGSAYLVKLPVDGAAGDTDATATQQPAPNVSRANATPSELMAVWSETFLGPVMATLERTQARVGELEREVGRLSAELAAAQASQQPQAGSGAPESPDPPTEPAPRPSPLPWPLPPTPNIRAAGAALLLAVLAIAAAVVLLVVR